MSETPYLILNGEMLSAKDAFIAPDNRGMMYGDGCFETLRSYQSKFLEWKLHMKRLNAGMNYLAIEMPADPKTLKKHILQLLDANELSSSEAMIRIQCWREGGRGYFDASTNASYMIQCGPLPKSIGSYKLTVAETRCIPSKALERKHKLSNGLNYIKAAQEANARSCEDALMLTLEGQVSETTSANIFWIKDEQVYTPSEKCDLLPGVTRNIVLRMMNDNGIHVQEGIFDLKAIQNAEAVFTTNSLREIRAVDALDESSYDIKHPLFGKILQGFNTYKAEALKA